MRRLSPLRDASRYLFVATLVYAPWAYGCTTADTILVLNWLLAGVAALWIGDLLFRWKLPFVPPALVVLLALVLALGWAMALNARAIYDPAFSMFALTQPRFPKLPGSYDAANSMAMMIRVTLLAFVVCFVADLCQRPVWVLRLWQAIAFAGASIALLGLLEKGSGARMIFWESWAGNEPPRFFATYFYHANAAAFLNLIVLPTLALALRDLLRHDAGPVARALSITGAVAAMLAVIANTSRAQALGLVLIFLFALGPVRRAIRDIRGREERAANRWQAAVAAVVGLVAIVAVAQASRLNEPLKRWGDLAQSVPQDARWLAAKAALAAVPDAGWFGFGPGTFRSIFPSYQFASGSKLAGTWRFLHEDYLQTVLEWGYLGSALIFVTASVGVLIALNRWRVSGRQWFPRQRTLLPIVALSLGAVAIHAFVDFPLQIASIQLFAATYLGVCWGAWLWTPVHVPAESSSRSRGDAE